MNKMFRYILIALMVTWGMAGLLAGLFASWAFAEEGNGSVSILTGRNASVKGDVGKFRAHHWMKDGYVGGIGSMTFDEKVGKDTEFSFEGHTLPAENDNEVEMILRKGDAGFIKTEYTSFRKYFSDVGGKYNGFSLMQSARLTNQDLEMNMGHFGLEMGLGSESHPDLALMYERHTKKGIKSRLTWAPIKENATTRNIAPVWQQVDETADIVTLKGKKDVAGVTVKGEQKAEFVGSRNYREEQSLSPTSTAATDFKIRAQEQKPEARVLTSTLRGEKWVLDDKTFLAMGYRFNNVHNTEKERLRELNRGYGLTNFSTNAEQRLLSDAENRSNEHIYTAHLNSALTPELSFISKLKVAYSGGAGSSTYPYDSLNATPDGIADNTQASRVENRINRLGENFSLRYSGIAHTALYSEVELEQTRNWLSEYRDSIPGQNGGSVSEYFARETLTHIQKTNWTVGGRVVPSQYWNVTAQVRQRTENNDYDDLAETVSTTTAKSAFFDNLKIKADEAETKLTFKPMTWLQNSLRYQYLNTRYFPRAEDQVNTESRMLSHILTYEVTAQPMDPLLLTVAFSHQQLGTKTSAGQSAASTRTPGFNADVNSWLFSASYSPTDNLTLINTASISRAANFNDFSSAGLPLGANFNQYDITTGIDWSPKKGVKVSPSYEYAMYDGGLSEEGDYSAHIAWLDVSFDW